MGLDFRFDPIDLDQVRLVRSLSAGQRIQRLLHARALGADVNALWETIKEATRRQAQN